MAFGNSPGMVSKIGVYGLGFVSMAFAAVLNSLRYFGKLRSLSFFAVVLFLIYLVFPSTSQPAMAGRTTIAVVGIQFESANEHVILCGLDQVLRKFPQTKLIMLSEYTFNSPVPKSVCDWCRKNRRFLVAGGVEPLGETNFYDMAYVVGPNGEIVHRQAKSVPIQFFKDGLPAPQQEVWKSPWGPIGILICYDLDYSRVTDNLIRQGAQALLVPTMDVSDWGKHEHELASRVAPLRAAEYGVPIFRVCSSGISQLVNSTGAVTASAPFPGVCSMIAGGLELAKNPRLPLDRTLTPICVAVVAAMTIGVIVSTLWKKRTGTES
jgi:hypothetical protein